MAEPGPGARQLAELFHDRYERLAPSFGYETRKETRAFDPTSTNGRLMIAVCDEILTWFDRQDTANLNAELETERMRLAGCGVAALADTPETVAQRLTRDSPYWSASYGDVCRMVDRLMELRALLVESRRPHYECDDCWYSCPMSGECCDNKKTGCTCDAEEWNAKLDAFLGGVETTSRLEDHENYCNEHGGHLRDSPACYLARERARGSQ